MRLADSARGPHALRRWSGTLVCKLTRRRRRRPPLQRRGSRRKLLRRRASGPARAGGLECLEELALSSGSRRQVGRSGRGRRLRREEEFGRGEGEGVVRRRVGGEKCGEGDRRLDTLSSSVNDASVFCTKRRSSLGNALDPCDGFWPLERFFPLHPARHVVVPVDERVLVVVPAHRPTTLLQLVDLERTWP